MRVDFVQPLTITNISFEPYQVPFRLPFMIKGVELLHREGFIVRVTTSCGLTGSGEAAPLPGVSREDLKKARHDLSVAQQFLPTFELPQERLSLIGKIQADNRITGFCPSVRFGLEAAFFDVVSRYHKVSLGAWLGASVDHVPVVALLQGNKEQVIQEATLMKAQGCHLFKLKVGSRNIPLDVKKVQDLKGVIGPKGLLRLDANRAWGFKEAVLFGQLATAAQIDFIEEPLSDMGQVGAFYQATQMPVALDETLLSPQGDLVTNEAVKALVLKPTLLGGIIVTLGWIEKARQLNKKAVISAAFESPVGINTLKHLACLTGQPAGLGTSRWVT